MTRTLVRFALGCALVTASSLTAAVSYFTAARYLAHEDAVDALLASLPRQERHIPPIVRSVLTRLEGEGVTGWVAMNLVLATSPAPLSNIEWHASNALWALLLPYRFTVDERIALYGHFMAFEDGRGLEYGAKFYFSKPPAELTEEEAIGLLVISRAPRGFSPANNQERYRANVDRLLARYRNAI